MSTVKDILHKRMKTKKKKNYTDQTLLLYMCEKICIEKCKYNHFENKSKLKIKPNKNIKLCRMLQL